MMKENDGMKKKTPDLCLRVWVLLSLSILVLMYCCTKPMYTKTLVDNRNQVQTERREGQGSSYVCPRMSRLQYSVPDYDECVGW